jgi:hypothetical protein
MNTSGRRQDNTFLGDSMRARVWMAMVGVVALAGCHAKFKKEAPALGAVRTQVIVNGGPSVELGHVEGDNLVGAVVNVVQEVKAIKPQRRIQEAVKIDQVNYSVQTGIRDVLDQGPPFAYTDDPKAAVLQLDLVSWGLYVPYLGAQGEFDYEFKVRIYKPDGDRVYKTSMVCSTAAGAPPTASLVFGTVNNVKQLEQMSDQQIQDAFDSVAYWCGGQLVSRMRRHAG